MNQPLKIGSMELFWLNGGEFELDGGTMFGAVPKVLWEKKFPATATNTIRLLNAPLLVKTPEALVLVETGLGNKLTAKQKKIFAVVRGWTLPQDLARLGFTRQDITHVILTHCDFDHAGGIVMHGKNGRPELAFPNAVHLVQQREWQDVLSPNLRTSPTYWDNNFEGLAESGMLQLVDGGLQVVPGVSVRYTGGHTRGHQIVRIESTGELAVHLSDLLPTHVHFNPLWIMAYDNFPLEVIDLKQRLIPEVISRNGWFTFYHDPFMLACRFDRDGRVIEKIPA